MATTRTKDVGVTKTTLAADTYLYGDGNTDGSHKILGSDVANYVASEEGGSTLASLSGGKVPTAQLPWTGETFLGTSTVASLPAPGGLSAGEYYITTDSGTNHSVTFAAGDKAISDGTSYYAVADGVRPIGEGGTGASTAEGARTNLEVDSSDEIAEGLTRGEPSLYFNGGIVQIGTDSGLNLTDGANIDFPQSLSFWVKAEDWTDGTQVLAERHSASRGWQFYISGSGELTYLKSDGTENVSRATSSLSVENGKWYQVFVTDPGIDASTPSSVALDGISIYVNGESQTLAAASSATYEGIGTSNTQLNIGGFAAGSGNFQGEIRNVQIFNTALSAADVETIYRSGVPFELDQASATATYESDFSAGVDSFSDINGTVVGNIDSIGGQNDNLRFTTDNTTGQHYIRRDVSLLRGKRYRVSFEYYIPSSNSDMVDLAPGPAGFGASIIGATLDAWTRYEHEFVEDRSDSFYYIRGATAASSSFTDSGGDDVFYIRNVTVKDAGCTLDLDIPGTNGTTVPDRSGNGFNGTLDSMTVAGNLVGLPSTLSANNPNPSSGQALCSLGNNGTEVFKVDDSGNTVIAGDPVITNSTTPASASATGTAGTVAWDANYIYVCTATNTWKRAAISTW